MNILKNILLLFLLASITACSDTKFENDKSNSETLLLVTTDNVSNEISPDSTVMAFLKWYRDHEDSLHQIQLITGGLEDTTTFYSVDFKETGRYLTKLKKSGYLSDRFLNELQKHFVQSNEYLKQHPQNDGPAPGFEADLIMKAQDYMDVWDNLDSSKVIEKKVDNSKASIKMLFAGYYKTKYYLTKTGNKWLIDNINNAFAEN